MVVVGASPKRRAPSRVWTYADYCRLDDDQRVEVLEGELSPMYPGPDLGHQDTVGALYTRMKVHSDAGHLGRVVIAPFDVILDDRNVVQPDVIFVSKGRQEILKERGVFGAPDLVVEVISPSSLSRDRNRKRKLYARFGIREFWIVDRRNESIEVFVLRQGEYELHSFAAEKGLVKSSVLKGFSLNLADLG